MELTLNLSLLLLGMTILIWGANKFVDNSSMIAKHLGIGDLVIGLTLIAAGTSAPEVFIGISAIIKGNEDIALGMAIGSNISNIALIFGVACLYFNTNSKTALWNLMPVGLSILMLGLTLADGKISFNESIGFVGLFMLFMYILLKTEDEFEDGRSESSEFIRSLVLCMVGLAGLIAGANISIIYAENTAILLGVPEIIIGLTIIALGTSLPELAASFAALKQQKYQMVVGNIIGSNVLNLVFIIPMIGFFGSVQLNPVIMLRDFNVLAILTLVFILLAISLTKLKFVRGLYMTSGIILISSYLLYIVTLAGIV